MPGTIPSALYILTHIILTQHYKVSTAIIPILESLFFRAVFGSLKKWVEGRDSPHTHSHPHDQRPHQVVDLF